MRLASFNVENLFARAKVLNTATWDEGHPQLAAFERFNRTAQRRFYRKVDKRQMLRDLETLAVITRASSNGRLIRQPNTAAQMAILRENRGDFMIERQEDRDRDRRNRADPLDRMARARRRAGRRGGDPDDGKVIQDLAAGVLAVVEAEHRPSLVRFNEAMLANRYRHVMLVDGNDQRGIDVGLLTTARRPIVHVESHVDDRDTKNPNPPRRDNRLFSRDAPVFTVRCGSEDLLVDRQPPQVAVADRRRTARRPAHAPVDPPRGDLPPAAPRRRNVHRHGRRLQPRTRGDGGHPSLEALFRPALGLVDAFSLPQFDPGPRPGTFQSCSLRDRLDYIFLSPELAARVTRGGVFRRGLWGRPTNKNPPEDWEIYPEITESVHAASDHAAIWVDLDFP